MRPRFSLFALLLLLCEAAFAQSGFVKSAGQPIPGATVTATQADKTVSTVTDPDGYYAFPPLGPGIWTVSVEMFGFEAPKKDVNCAAIKGLVNFDLELKPSPVLQTLQQWAGRRSGASAGAGGGDTPWGGSRRGQNGDPGKDTPADGLSNP